MVNNAVLRGRIIDRRYMGELLYMRPPKSLTAEQESYWHDRLELAERMAEDAMRMLGILKPEDGMKG